MQAEPHPQRRSQRVALAVLMGLAFIVVAWMAAPLLVGLALGAVMGFTAQPLCGRLVPRMKHRRRLASAVTTLLGGLLMAGGGAFAIWIIAREIVAAIALIQTMMGPRGPTILGPRMLRALEAVGIQREVVLARLQEELGHLANLAAEGAGILVQASFGVILTLIVALWTMYYVLIDWQRIAYHLEHVLPLDPEHTRALVTEFREVGRTAFLGTLASAIIQGILAGIGFEAFGVPQGITWAAVLAVASFIPVVGVPLVWVPISPLVRVHGSPRSRRPAHGVVPRRRRSDQRVRDPPAPHRRRKPRASAADTRGNPGRHLGLRYRRRDRGPRRDVALRCIRADLRARA